MAHFRAHAQKAVDPVERENKEIERRRQRLEDRRRRILGGRSQVGVDREYVLKQIEDKREKDQKAREEEIAWQDQAAEVAQRAAAMDMAARRAKANQQRETLLYNQKQSEVQKHKLQTMYDPDPKIAGDTLTTFLKFGGEDLGKKDRVAMQAEQQRAWCAQQMAEKQRARLLEEEEQRQYGEQLMQVNAFAETQSVQARQQKAQQKAVLRDTNLMLLEQRQLAAKVLKEKEEQQERANAEAMLKSDFMTERVSRRQDDPSRYIPYHFKGFDMGQKQAIMDEQLRQIESKENREREQRELERREAEEREEVRKRVIAMERQRRSVQAQHASAVRDQNRALHEQHTAQAAHLNDLYKGAFTEDFFNNFGQSAR